MKRTVLLRILMSLTIFQLLFIKFSSTYQFISAVKNKNRARVLLNSKAIGKVFESDTTSMKSKCLFWCSSNNQCEAANYYHGNEPPLCHLLMEVTSFTNDTGSVAYDFKKVFCSGYCSALAYQNMCGVCTCFELCGNVEPFRCNCTKEITGHIFKSCGDALKSFDNRTAIYTIDYTGTSPKPLYCFPILHKLHVQQIGCYIDKRERALPNLIRFTYDSKDPSKTIRLCRDHVLKLRSSYMYFGIQAHSQCFYGSGDEKELNFKRYGTGSGCDALVGFGWHNMIYKVDRN